MAASTGPAQDLTYGPNSPWQRTDLAPDAHSDGDNVTAFSCELTGEPTRLQRVALQHGHALVKLSWI